MINIFIRKFRRESLISEHYTLPDKPEDYIHRVGRVGRADKMGLAISIVGSTKEKVKASFEKLNADKHSGLVSSMCFER